MVNSFLMDSLETLVDNGLSDSTLDAVLNDLLVNNAFDSDCDRRCCVTLAWYRGQGNKTGPADCNHLHDKTIKIDGCEYLVCDEDEADKALDDYLESCLDDEGVVLGSSSPYFDREAWKKDAAIDGRGHSLASYDGDEHELCVHREGKNDWYFLYRTN